MPGDKRLRGKKLLILTILLAKATPELAKRTILSIKRTIGDGKHTISLETVSKSSARTSKRTILSIKRAIGHTKHTIPSETVSKMKDLKPPGETWAGEAKFLENGRVPNALQNHL